MWPPPVWPTRSPLPRAYYSGQIMPYLDERPEAALAKQRTLDHFAAHLG